MRRGINECVGCPSIVEWEEEPVGKGERSRDKILAVKISPLCFCCSVPNRCSSFGSNLRVVLSLVCWPWYPRFQPDLSTPAKKTKKAEIDLPPSVLLPLTRFPNRKTNKCRKTERYAIHGFGCEVRWCVGVSLWKWQARRRIFFLSLWRVEGSKYNEK